MEQDWAEAFYTKDSKDPDAMQHVRVKFATLAKELQQLLPPSRPRSLVLTKLEEAAMWATKSFTHG